MSTETLLTDRVLATVLFTDIVGSTQMAVELGDQRWKALLDEHLAATRAEVARFQGREISTSGDGFLATFDSPARAVLCARAIAEASAALGTHVRAGIHTGELELVGDDILGIAVHVGARIAGLAGPDEILVSSVVKDLVQGSHIEFVPKGGPRALKGVPGRWRVFALDWEPPRAAPPAIGRRAAYPLVGRTSEAGAIREELDVAAAGSMRVLTVEGEAGIGKTRLLDEAADIAANRGFQAVFVGADEEVGGPFYLARALLASPALVSAASPEARKAVSAAQDALAGKLHESLQGLPYEDRMLHVFDVSAVALRAVAERRPVAVLLDDLQWADEDSLRLIRFLIRTDPAVHLFVMLAFRPDETPATDALRSLSVDAERLGVSRRLTLSRLSEAESKELLEHLLGGPASPRCAQALFAQSEGVPFILEELVRSFRDSGTVQSIEGTWEMTTAGLRMIPSSVRSLIERKAGQLAEASREVLADAAALGRRFPLADLATVTRTLKGDAGPTPAELASLLDPAVRAGLLAEAPEGSRFDYAFTHDQARAVLAAAHGRPRRRLVHEAILKMIDPDGHPPAERLGELTHHAILAGNGEAAGRYALGGGRAAMDASAPEQALRLAEAGLEAVEAADVRLDLLRLRDDALEVLLRGAERSAGLEEFARLAAQSGDPGLELEVIRRRSAAARMTGDVELAAELARMGQETARARGDLAEELEATLQLGQAIMRAPLLEAFSPAPSEIDLAAAREAYGRALELAEELGNERLVAVVKRELGVIQNGLAKHAAGEALAPMVKQTGRFQLPPADDPGWAPIDEEFAEGRRLLGEALDTFERLDDRAGVMATIIALSYAHYHGGVRRGVAGVIEQIRKLRARLRSMLGEGERQQDEMQMLFAVHTYARTYHYVDLALQRGEEAVRLARSLGYRPLEFNAAGGLGLTHLELGEVTEAEAWLDRARSAAMVQPTPLRARRLELWRGLARAEAGDAPRAIERLERARALGWEQLNRPGAAEATSALALWTARMAADQNDPKLLQRAEAWAGEAYELASALPGQHPWTAQALAARAQVLLAKGADEGAAAAAVEALTVMDARLLEPVVLEVVLVAGRCLAGDAHERAPEVRDRIRRDLEEIAGLIQDEDVRRRWLNAPIPAELVGIVGELRLDAPAEEAPSLRAPLTDRETEVLRLVAAGMTNREIGEQLGVGAKTVGRHLANVFTKLGVKSRSAATTYALQQGIA